MNLARYVLAAVREGETIAAVLAVPVAERAQARRPQSAADCQAAAKAAIDYLYEEQAA